MWESIAASAIGGLLGGSSSGGGTQTVSKDPWAPAQDWIKSNIGTGQELQKQYAANPFSEYQKQAYGNSQQLSQNARSILGNLIPQMSGHQGFDRSNPMQKPQGFNFASPVQGSAIGGTNFGMGNMGPSVDANSAMQMSDLRAQIAALQAAAKLQAARPQQAWESSNGGGDTGGSGFGGVGGYGGEGYGAGTDGSSGGYGSSYGSGSVGGY